MHIPHTRVIVARNAILVHAALHGISPTDKIMQLNTYITPRSTRPSPTPLQHVCRSRPDQVHAHN